MLTPYDRLCRALNRFDSGIIDGAVNAGGFTANLGGHILKLFQTGFVRNYALSFLIGAGVILWLFLR